MAVATPWGPIGYPTYKRTYARRLRDSANSPTEEFEQTVDRVIKACETQLGCGFTKAEEAELRDIILGLEGSVAGRFLWQLGTKTVDRLGLMSLQNCAFVTVDQPIRPFTWTMDALMLGSGVGYNIQRENVYQIPSPKRARIVRRDTNDADFIVPDSREGWVKLLGKVLKTHFYTGKGFSYSTLCVRSAGAVIKGFGGVASGPEELCWGMEEISKLLNSRAGKRLRPIDCLDIMNIIGYVVVAGNVRRSAQIAIGDYDDLQYLDAKRFMNDDGTPRILPRWRGMSNNSVVCNDFAALPPQFWNTYSGKSEPYGLINLKLAQEVGRIGDYRYPDPQVKGFNPCAEQSLANHETCCLAEMFLPNIKSKERLLTVARYLYRINKHSLSLPCHASETENIVHAHMRMGIGVTGYLQATDEQRSWLPDVYEELRAFDEWYSTAHGWPASIKLTTCKPSGTLSLLAGVTPGVHPGTSLFFKRRIRMAVNSSLVELCRKSGYHIEYAQDINGNELPERNTVVVTFPCRYSDGTVVAKDLSAVGQLEWVKKLQTDWSDNSVSCTVYYRPNEMDEIKAWLAENYNAGVKTVSFLLGSDDHGFAQAPYEEITEEQYNEMVAKVKPITSVEVAEDDIDGSFECAGGMCPIK